MILLEVLAYACLGGLVAIFLTVISTVIMCKLEDWVNG